MTQLQLLTACVNFSLFHAAEHEAEVHKELQTSGATRLVDALRMLRLQKAILAVGMFSLFEAVLQDQLGWKRPFKDLVTYLEDHDQSELAATFSDYYLAINVLKHGQGTSYDKLVLRRSSLEFTVGSPHEFYREGDVAEVQVLIDVDERFVRRCAEIIEHAANFIRSREPNVRL